MLSLFGFAPDGVYLARDVCSGWGLPCPRCYHNGGALLPHPFSFSLCIFCKIQWVVSSLWHCPSARAGRALPGIPPLWSPDFPRTVDLLKSTTRDRPAL